MRKDTSLVSFSINRNKVEYPANKENEAELYRDTVDEHLRGQYVRFLLYFFQEVCSVPLGKVIAAAFRASHVCFSCRGSMYIFFHRCWSWFYQGTEDWYFLTLCGVLNWVPWWKMLGPVDQPSSTVFHFSNHRNFRLWPPYVHKLVFIMSHWACFSASPPRVWLGIWPSWY